MISCFLSPFHIYFFLVLFLLVPRLNGLRVMITGGNGVLGQALIQHAVDTMKATTIFATYRTSSKWNMNNDPSIIPLLLDMNSDTKHNNKLSHFFINHPEIVASDQSFVLFNNAGVCLPGNTLSVLQTSLLVNCWAPALLSHALFRCPFTGYGRTVINVSSGDGELMLLHSEIQKQLQSIGNYEVGTMYLSSLSCCSFFIHMYIIDILTMIISIPST